MLVAAKKFTVGEQAFAFRQMHITLGAAHHILAFNGRLHRDHATKTDVRIYDYVDAGHPVLLRMWERRQRGYKAMGYQIKDDKYRIEG